MTHIFDDDHRQPDGVVSDARSDSVAATSVVIAPVSSVQFRTA
jgi:hypothetical protein